MSYRAQKSGIAAEVQKKVEANYDEEEAMRCLCWIHLVTDCDEIPCNPDLIDSSSENFYGLLHDGFLLCRLIDVLYPGKINWSSKSFQTPKIAAMKVMRERERIAMFNNFVKEYGVSDSYTFPAESLHERGALNLAQVCSCIRNLGIEAQTRPDFNGPTDFWPKKANKNVRVFSQKQMQEGKKYVSLQYGSNKGASQAGMMMGKQRMVLD